MTKKERNRLQSDAKKKIRFNAHDFGELGKFIRVEYAERIVNQIFAYGYGETKQ